MRTLFSFLLFLLTTLCYSQEEKSYLFDQFEDAFVSFKNNSEMRLKMNYNILYTQMIFKDNDGTCKALSNKDINNISLIKIKGRFFIPFKQGICEILSENPLLYVEYHSRLKPRVQNIGMGATSSTTAGTSYSEIRLQGGPKLELSTGVIPEADLLLTYWVLVDGKYKSFKTVKQLKKALSDNKNDIENYVITNKLNTNKPDQILLLFRSIFEKR